jgi:hypothetical protein
MGLDFGPEQGDVLAHLFRRGELVEDEVVPARRGPPD